jgi:hypothetical protein
MERWASPDSFAMPSEFAYFFSDLMEITPTDTTALLLGETGTRKEPPRRHAQAQHPSFVAKAPFTHSATFERPVIFEGYQEGRRSRPPNVMTDYFQ